MSLISLGITLLCLVLGVAIAWYCINNTFQGKLFYYRLFKLRAISGKTSTGSDGWTKAENTLGGDFKKFIPAMDREEFENCKTYLALAGDKGRQPLPFWLIAMIGTLIIAEGLGFSYLLGTFIAPEGTADTYTLLMVALVLVLCVVLGMITHAAGHQLYRTRLINANRQEWQQTHTDDNPQFKTHEVLLLQPQNCDANQPPYTRLANRVGDKGQYTMVIIAIITIVTIAVFSTAMRVKAHEKAEADRTVGAVVSAEASNPFADKGGNGLPEAVTAPNQQANDNAAKQIHDAGTQEALSAFIILAVIFVITQIVAIYAGFKWGFGGQESAAAYRRTRGFSTWTEAREVKDAFIEPVEELMTALHAKFSESNRKLAVHSFKQYLSKTAAAADAEDREAADREAARKATDAARSAAAAAPAPAAAAPLAPQPADADPVQAHLDAIDRLTAKEDKERYVLELEVGQRAAVIQAIKARQQRAAAAKEVEGLF
ncbi:hypothetical protein ACLB1G_18430 [Oxalobacteraceae bacterium A2-2]